MHMHKTPAGKRFSSGLQEVRVVGVTMHPSENSSHGHGSRLTNLGRKQNYRDAKLSLHLNYSLHKRMRHMKSDKYLLIGAIF